MSRARVAAVAVVSLLASLFTVVQATQAQAGPCDPPNNAIVCENSKPGNPASEWQISGAGSDEIQGFATDISVNAGGRIDFKIKTAATAYDIEIFRLGWYQGDGARRQATLSPSVSLPQSQPPCQEDPSTNLFDCGNWSVSASWSVPSSAVSGVYVALIGGEATGWSHITFVVRNDSSRSDVVFQTSDTTWQAYNAYGGSNFYTGTRQLTGGQARAFKISYNRPFATRGGVAKRDFLFANEYPMLRFLERNGFDVSYISGLDTDRTGSRLLNHKVFLSVGHDEYWSGRQRANVEAARDQGVNLAFFSGNEVYWKTRWEPSIDGSATANRTLVSYKETWDDAKIDPSAEWTGTWRDPRFSPPSDGGRPENALTGTAYMSNHLDLAMTVPAAQGKQRYWRNTRVASLQTGQVATLAPHTVGYESDEDVENGFRNAGQIRLSETTGTTPEYLRDWGRTVTPGTTTHHMTMYKAPSGAKVFGAGTIQWSWGLDEFHDGGSGEPADPAMQQFTINVLGDMGARGSTLMSGMVQPAASSDATAPVATITAPASGAAIPNGTSVTATGSATDSGGGVVAGVEVSTDGGTSWHPAKLDGGTWSYTYIQKGNGVQSIRARATDDSLNTGTAASIAISTDCPCSVFGSAIPDTADAGADNPVTLGMRFKPKSDGWVNGMRFYKSSLNTGTHTGSLWTNQGTRLATGTFVNETASGWQTLTFSAPVQVTAGVTYVVGYLAPNGHYALQPWGFALGDINADPLVAKGNTVQERNGLFAYGAHQFPTQSHNASNYWVDVSFSDKDVFPPVALSQTPTPEASSVDPAVLPSAVLSEPVQADSVQFTLRDASDRAVEGTTAYDATTRTISFRPLQSLVRGERYTASVFAMDMVGNAMPNTQQWSFRVAEPDLVPGTCPCRLWDDDQSPSVTTVDEAAALELGTRFTPSTDGQITGVRFYKGPQNTGTHTGSLWSTAGSRLATATFVSESSTGWQTVTFSTPITVQKGTTYVASYSTSVGYYSATWGGFTAGLDRPPLSVRPEAGAYKYGGGYPAGVSSANYWVDPIFTVPASMPPTVQSIAPAAGSVSVPVGEKVSVRFADLVQPGSGTITVTGPAGTVAGQTALDASWTTLTFAPTAPLAQNASYTVTIAGVRNLGGHPMQAPVVSTFTTSGSASCPCTLFSSTAVPKVADSGEGSSVTLGVRIVPEVDGYISGVRFYKSAANTGVHTGSVWSSTGTRLATARFADETASGWQQVTFSQAVSVTAGVPYVVGYHAPNGHFAADSGFFSSTWTNSPLSAPSGSNGLFTYNGDAFPDASYQHSNYWVDAIFSPGTAPDTSPPTLSSTDPTNGAVRVPQQTAVSAVFSEPVQAGATLEVKNANGELVTGGTTYDATSRRITFTPASSLADRSTYTVFVTASDLLGNAMESPASWSFTTNGDRTCPCSVFEPSERPAIENEPDRGGALELGVAVRPADSGYITAIRFFKGSGNTGTHTGSVWSSTGDLLGSGTFTGETASGWQTLVLDRPVPVVSGTTYVASYTNPNGMYSVTTQQFARGLSSPPLEVVESGGRFRYGGGFPANTSAANYWVDVVFDRSSTPPPPDTTAPAISQVVASASGTSATVAWTTDESATSRVDYGTSPTALDQNAIGTAGTSHSVSLSGLTAGTTYYYRVTSADSAGNSTTDPVTTSAPRSFQTTAAADTTAPVITQVQASASGTSATVTWTTDESATSRVDYGTSPTALSQNATGATGTSHSVNLTGLTAGTTYYYRVTSADSAGNSTTDPVTSSAPRTFQVPAAADTTAPVVSDVAATGSGTTATVTWTTDESATSRVDYGLTASTLDLTATGASGTSHSVALTGLQPNTRYYYRVTSADAAGNSTTAPATSGAPAAYVPGVEAVVHSTVADFATGTGAYVSDTSGGEVLSTPTLGTEFTGTAVPSGWTNNVLVTGGTTTVADGSATISGSRLRTTTAWSTGRSFAAALELRPGQSVGWGSVANGSTGVTASFALAANGDLTTRLSSTGATTATATVPGTWTGKHEYRVDWTTGVATFFVDGTQVGTGTFTPTVNLRVMLVDPSQDASPLVVDWVRVAPYAGSRTYTSAVIDAGATVGWDTLTRDVSVPSGTGLVVQVRSGPTPTPGTGWTTWSTVSESSNSITRNARYLQYRLQMTISGTRFVSPTTRGVEIRFHVL